MTHIGFYAVRDDLIDLLRLVESEAALRYTLTGNFLKSEVGSSVRVFETGVSIPTLGTASANSSASCEEYLVFTPDVSVNLRAVGKNGERICVDQLANADSVTFTPCGIWNDSVVLEGRIATASDSHLSQILMKRFHAAVTQLFSKVGSCYVGQKTLALLHKGMRFTSDAQSPAAYDLVPVDSARHVNSQHAARLSYEDSYKLLQRLNHLPASTGGTTPHKPDHRPQFDDEDLVGIRFFRTSLVESDLESLTLTRAFFGRSEIASVTFKNTNLSESTLCWNDFSGVNFSDADLSDCDLRASLFRECSFVRANLRDADLRRSNFKQCDFADANLRGAKLTHKQGEQIHLSEQQKAEVDWQESDGEQPPGG